MYVPFPCEPDDVRPKRSEVVVAIVAVVLVVLVVLLIVGSRPL
jgi:hypothetical protein